MAELTSVEIKHWIDENKEDLKKARFDKAWQIDNTIIIRFYIKGKGSKELVITQGGLFFTSYSIEKPPVPTNFAMLLRKYLKGKWVKDVYQYDLDRILVLKFDDISLIIEVMKPTNIILTNHNERILGILKPIKSKNRELNIKGTYSFPEKKKNILLEKKEEFEREVKDIGIENIYKKYYLSPKYVKYAIEKYKDIDSIFNFLKQIFNEKRPCTCKDEIYAFCIKENCKIFDTINEAIEHVFIENIKNLSVEISPSSKENRKVQHMEKGLEKLIKQKEELEEKVNILYANFPLLQDVLEKISLKQEHPLIQNVNYKEKKMTIVVEGKKIEIDYSLNAYQNISEYHNKIKELKEKIDNLKEKIEREKKKNNIQEESKKIKIKVEKKVKKKWYENFKWFITSKGRLFVLGKDATTNEILIKKYMEKQDLVFHMLLPGSGFGLLKGGREEQNEEEILECAQFTVCHSSLWKQKVYSGEAFWVFPEQVSKKAPSGEYISKGSFMIYGKKNILKVPLEIAFGYDTENKEIIYGPLSKVIKKTKHYAIVIPGDKKDSELVKKIKKKIIQNLKKEDQEIVMAYDDEFFKERIPFRSGNIRGKI